jgi:hypothetical protein
MGRGSALGEISSGPQIMREQAKLAILRSENVDGHIALLFDAEGLSAVKPNIVFRGLVLGARRPFGGDIHIDVPLVPSRPEAPDVAVVGLTATIGPAAGLRYTETVRGQLVSYTPNGILLPGRCPRGGFPFAASFAFSDGSRASAQAHVRCPLKNGAHRQRRGHT